MIGESGYGSCISYVTVLSARSLVELAHKVRNRRSRRSGDNPGQAYMWECKVIAIYKTDDNEFSGIAVCSTHYDV
jgi:hypothetical protein